MELAIYKNIISDDALSALNAGNAGVAMGKIISFAETNGISSDAVREYIVSLLAGDENILSQKAQSGKNIGEDLYKYALADIEKIYNRFLAENTYPKYTPSESFKGFYEGYALSIAELMRCTEPKTILDTLIEHYKTLGSGIFAKYAAFRYSEKGLEGISELDDITFDDLVGIDYQKQVMIDNTEAFLSDSRANNVLLFGDRGTGKSSSVKALLNAYYSDGLRMIEVPKRCIRNIPDLSNELAQRPHKYILFLDDLSFEAGETDYRALKVAMEGQLRANPSNVLIYATSNRRHLIKETWSDREGGEIHVNDNVQETLSLSERFGISLVFSAPSSQKEYLNIVRSLLEAKGIEMTVETEREAVVWQMNYGSRSGRCAGQFAAAYEAKSKKIKKEN